MNQIGTVLKIHAKDRWSLFYIPWLILLSSFFINLIIGYFIRNIEPGGVTTGGIMSIFVYMFFAGLFVLYSTYAFAIGFSITRRDYFLGTTAMMGIVAIAVAIILTVMAMFENMTGGWGVNLHFFDMPFLEEMGLLGEVLLYFWTFAHLYTLGFVISSIHRRFGRNGLFIFFIAIILVTSVIALLATAQNWWIDLFEWITQYTMVEIFNTVMLLEAGLSIIYLIFTYLLLRRATV